jgi:hypothetical protein
VTLVRSTVSRNVAGLEGGGLWVDADQRGKGRLLTVRDGKRRMRIVIT